MEKKKTASGARQSKSATTTKAKTGANTKDKPNKAVIESKRKTSKAPALPKKVASTKSETKKVASADKIENKNNTKNVADKSKNKKNGTGLVLFVTSMALVVGLFIGNTLMPAMNYANSKSNQNLQQNESGNINIDMTPREVKVDENYTTFDEVAPQVSCCVVGINAFGNNFSSVGSGVAVAEGGYLLTNYHVIEDANYIDILLADSTMAFAEVLWQDSGLDLAILKCSVDLPWLEIGTPDEVSVGEPVMAVGTPLSLQFQHSHTAGIISALNRMIAIEGSDGDTYMQNLIQHDASINPGNSGGPAITLDGKIIGINTLKISEAEGIGFAVPAWIVKPLLEHVINDGYYETVYLGVYAFDSAIAEYNGYETSTNGVIVAKVDETGPLAQVGISVGDVITKVGDMEINSMLDLRVALYHYKVGDSVDITVSRCDSEQTVTITLEKHPNA